MKVAIIGRSEIMYDTALRLRGAGHEIRAIVTAKEAPEYTRTAADFEALAAQWKVPFVQTPRITEAEAQLRAAGPIDIGISYNYTGIIPGSTIALFPFGILNAHGGDLPRYRGNACQAWAILNGEERIGLCVHSMVPDELDSGDILARDYFPLTLATKITAVHAWMARRVPELFEEAVRRLAADPSYVLCTQSKDPADALRCYPRRPDDGRINWRASAVDIVRLVNACNKPYAGAFCSFDGRRLVVWEAEPGPFENFLAVPGQVARISPEGVDVTTGGGLVRLKVVEGDEGPVPPAQLVRSLRARLE